MARELLSSDFDKDILLLCDRGCLDGMA